MATRKYIPLVMTMQIVSNLALPLSLDVHLEPCERLSPDGAILHINCGYTTVTKEYLRSFGENVRIAHLENNNFTILDQDLFTVWPKLNKLYLDNNHNLRTTDFSHKSLKYISFADCGLKEFNIPDRKNLPSLKCIHLGGNQACAPAEEIAEEQCVDFGLDCGSGCPTQPYTCNSAPTNTQSYIVPIICGTVIFAFFMFLALYRRPMVRKSDTGLVII